MFEHRVNVEFSCLTLFFLQSMDLGRRQVVQTGAAAAAVAPFLQNMPASANFDKSAKAPVITIFDHRGCTAHKNTEYFRAGRCQEASGVHQLRGQGHRRRLHWPQVNVLWEAELRSIVGSCTYRLRWTGTTASRSM
jgi:hypothetical protein